MHKNDIDKYIVGHYPIDTNDKTKNYYQFGELYYSKVGTPVNSSIVWHFPLNELRPNEFIYYLYEDIFPTSWTLFGSNDGTNWTELIYSNESMCPSYLQYEVYNGVVLRYFCHETIVSILFNNTKPYKFLKYTQHRNSYYYPSNYRYVIFNLGVDFGGYLTTDYFLCTPSKSNNLNLSFLIYVFILI